MCDRCSPYHDHMTEEEQEYWEDRYYAQQAHHAEQQKEYDDMVSRNYEQHLRELHEAAFERGETWIDV